MIDVNLFAAAGVLDGVDVAGVARVGDGSIAFSVHREGAEAVAVRFVGIVEIAGARTTMQAMVPVVWSEQRIGRHAWWLCPTCGRRARLLYSTDLAGLGCRICLGLRHRSAVDHAGRGQENQRRGVRAVSLSSGVDRRSPVTNPA